MTLMMGFNNKTFCMKIFSSLLNYNNIRNVSKWIQPVGYDTNIKIYNCIVRDTVPLILRNKLFATWYTCGPTVYDSTHIGHACCYVKLDIIQRILREYFKINLITVMNITNIDDKIIKKSKEQAVESSLLAWKYEQEFWDDMFSLNVNRPDITARVTDYISDIEYFIQKLINENKAYITQSSSVYFSLQKYDNYSKLENISLIQNVTNLETEKKSPNDFVLWKSATKGEPSWKVTWGEGRPGWHVECSAIASKFLGSEIDFHAGGIDLRFPHHENEEAQSCTFHNTYQWVNYWIHTGHLHLKDAIKMSKSLGNTISVKQLLQNYSCDEFRIACLLSHYRNNMVFSEDMMKNASMTLRKMQTFLKQCEIFIEKQLTCMDIGWDHLQNTFQYTITSVDSALRDDFDTAKALSNILKLIYTSNTFINVNDSSTQVNDNFQKYCLILAIKNYVLSNMKMFGLSAGHNFDYCQDKKLNNILDLVITFRDDIRHLALKNKDNTLFSLCDKLRTNLRHYDIEVKDNK